MLTPIAPPPRLALTALEASQPYVQPVSLVVCPTPCPDGGASTPDVQPASGTTEQARLRSEHLSPCGLNARLSWTVGGAHTVDSTRIMAGSWPPLAPSGGRAGGGSKPGRDKLLLPRECASLEAAAGDGGTGLCAQAAEWTHEPGNGTPTVFPACTHSLSCTYMHTRTHTHTDIHTHTHPYHPPSC